MDDADNDQDRAHFLPSASIANLELRSKLLQTVRGFFLDRGFFEVDTPLISRDTVVDCYIDPVSVELSAVRKCPTELWLQTSPEFAMKRLLAAGMKSIFQITRAFRNGERGDYHNPEFTIVEWYQVGQGYRQGRDMLGELIACSLPQTPSSTELSFAEAFERYAAVDPHGCSIAELEQAATAHGIVAPDSMNRADRDEWLNLLLAECVEAHLGVEQPTILYDYPASQAALARVDTAGDIPVAQRFEAYVDGIELANGYHELCDADELRRRNASNNKKREADGRAPLPADSYLISAMEHGLPECTGGALGFDRLVMLAADAKRIDDVIPFGIDRA